MSAWAYSAYTICTRKVPKLRRATTLWLILTQVALRVHEACVLKLTKAKVRGQLSTALCDRSQLQLDLQAAISLVLVAEANLQGDQHHA